MSDGLCTVYFKNGTDYAWAGRAATQANIRLQEGVGVGGYLSKFLLGVCSLRSCPLPIIPICVSREGGMIHFFVGSHVKKPESGLFSDWIGNSTDDLRCSDWPKCRLPLAVVDFSLHFCLRNE